MKQSNEVPGIVKAWVSSIKLTNPRQMAGFYSRNAVLLATYKPLLIGQRNIMGYFVTFLDKQGLKCKIISNITQQPTTKITIASGLYEFKYVENNKVVIVIARYSFVISENKIINHHSSVVPK
jgi:hypothetical protein